MKIDARVTDEDLRQYWRGCSAMLGDDPVFILDIKKAPGGKLSIRFKDLKDMALRTREVEPGEIKSPDSRMGFMNMNGLAAYLVRRPVRKFMMGINEYNTKVEYLNRCQYNQRIHVYNPQCPEFASMIKGEYPSLEEAYEMVGDFGGAVAFDRQFAIDEDHFLYYKTTHVGEVARVGGKVVTEFKNGYQHLSSVIGGFNREQALRYLRG